MTPQAAVQPVLRLDGVSKSYRTGDSVCRVLRDVGLTIAVGEKVSLIGPSGSGKSTLLSLIAGLLRPDEGVVQINGSPIGDLDDRARARIRAEQIGIALQSDNLIPFLTAAENVELALAFGTHASLAGHARPHRRERAEQALGLLDRFGVSHRAGHRPRHLSGGEAQRVALAVSVANDPGLLLADEVVAGLDADTAGGVIKDILAADFAVLFVTHDVGLADLAQRRFALSEEKVLAR